MRKLIFFILAIVTLSLCGCRTTQANMNDAYVKAIAARDSDHLGLDSTIYSNIRREMRHGSITVGDTTVDVSTQWVRITEGGGGIPEYLMKYNVVVGQFKQLFNAKSMRERLVESGYPRTFLVQTREPYYFIIVGSSNDISDALRILRKAAADPQLKMKAPLPFILEPAEHRY